MSDDNHKDEKDTNKKPSGLGDSVDTDAFEIELDGELDDIFGRIVKKDDDTGTEALELDDQFSAELEEATRSEVLTLFENILLQYIPSIKDCIQKIFRNQTSRATLRSFEGTLEPLTQAAISLQHTQLHEVFMEFQQYLDDAKHIKGKWHYKHIRPFAETFEKMLQALKPEIREQYFSDAKYKKNKIPLLEDIRTIRFIGPKKLQRFYATGLTSVEIIHAATPTEIAQTTGIGLDLAEKAKKVAKAFRLRKERERIDKIQAVIAELKDIIENFKDEGSLKVIHSTCDDFKHLQTMLDAHNAYLERVMEKYPRGKDVADSVHILKQFHRNDKDSNRNNSKGS